MSEESKAVARLRWLSLEEVAEILGLGRRRRINGVIGSGFKRPLTPREKRVRPVRRLINSGELMALNGQVREDWLADYQQRATVHAQISNNRAKLANAARLPGTFSDLEVPQGKPP